MREIVIVYAPRTQFNMPIRSHYYFEWIKFCKLNGNAYFCVSALENLWIR